MVYSDLWKGDLMNKQQLTLERAHALLLYRPMTGVFVWRINRGKARAGAVAGTLQHGYRKITLDEQICRAHRLAWFMTYGTWPKFQIDHIDGNKDNNAIGNLRDVSQSTNTQNRGRIRRKHAHLPQGVRPGAPGRFVASIQVGVFDSAEQAKAAYLRAKSLIHGGFVGGQHTF
ncbi:MAG: HNH endonuclease signature motif containing protein [Burkholderiales bacterium]